MNKKILIGVLAAAVLVIAIVTGIMLLRRPVAFNGSRVANPDAFLLTFTAMNGADSHTLSLKSGDTLCVSFAVEKGKIDVTIQAEGQAPIYRGNGIQTSSFELPISEAGNYTIQIEAQRAAGTLEFQVKAE